MSWEVVALTSVIVLCGTMGMLANTFFRYRVQEEASKQVAELLRMMGGLDKRMSAIEKARAEVLEIPIMQTRVKVLEENQVTMLKVVDEAKKMMSQQNMAATLGAGGFTSRVKV